VTSLRNVVQASTRLDDRVLGRWLHNRTPLPLAIMSTIAAVVFAVLAAILTGNVWILGIVFMVSASAWFARARRRTRS
jgi:hypothetical protein